MRPNELDAFTFAARAQRAPKLSREEEHALAVRAAAGERSALDALVTANLRYVTPMALKYRRYGAALDDLMAEAQLGLVVAALKFDAERGTRFVTYAAHWARAFMLEHILKNHSIVPIKGGVLRSRAFFRYRRERAALVTRGMDVARAHETLAERYGTTPERLAELTDRLHARDVSADMPTHGDGTSSLAESLAGTAPDAEDALVHSEQARTLHEQVAQALALLDAREQIIVRTRLMADDEEALTLAELGRRLGVSRERARQLETRARQKLARALADATPSHAHAA